ncbi:MAG: thioesterase [Candidatus Methanomethylophilus sp.]|nr:thioesterase [Methanomethylophilus sp.]MDD3232938.1 thioesterase [Methanomethylophilus sp.]MDD4221563.1 thioesterase [Methanomethylophilus sp.]MDD4668734.1 thioesterase [Methanomethylophilus sp.]
MISPGITGTRTLTVTAADTAAAYGSGTLPVLATPAVLLLVERTALESVAPQLAAGDTTVGTLAELHHTSSSPVGSTVTCRTELVEVDRARLRFSFKVTDRCGEVAFGFHERFVVHTEKFMAKAQAKMT